MITDSTLAAMGGMIAVIALLFLAISRFKWHVFIALLVPILLLALVPGMDRRAFIDAFEQGFGRTIQSIAVVIVLGSVLAEGLKHTGGIERITLSMIRVVGEKHMPLALTMSGFIIGLAIFSDVGYVILNPLVHSAAISSGVNMSVMATGLIGAMQLTHALVPPTPGPLAAVAIVGADLGLVILWGGLITLLASFAGWAFALVVGPRVESPPSVDFVGQSFVEQGRESELPSTWRAYAPILMPLALIAGQSVAAFALPPEHLVNSVMRYVGWPVVALGIGVLLAYRNTSRDQGGADGRVGGGSAPHLGHDHHGDGAWRLPEPGSAPHLGHDHHGDGAWRLPEPDSSPFFARRRPSTRWLLRCSPQVYRQFFCRSPLGSPAT